MQALAACMPVPSAVAQQAMPAACRDAFQAPKLLGEGLGQAATPSAHLQRHSGRCLVDCRFARPTHQASVGTKAGPFKYCPSAAAQHTAPMTASQAASSTLSRAWNSQSHLLCICTGTAANARGWHKQQHQPPAGPAHLLHICRPSKALEVGVPASGAAAQRAVPVASRSLLQAKAGCMSRSWAAHAAHQVALQQGICFLEIAVFRHTADLSYTCKLCSNLLCGLSSQNKIWTATEVLQQSQSCSHALHPLPCQRDSAGAQKLLCSALWMGTACRVTPHFPFDGASVQFQGVRRYATSTGYPSISPLTMQVRTQGCYCLPRRRASLR